MTFKEYYKTLVSETYPHSHWNKGDRDKLIGKIPVKLERDIWGNYYRQVGDSSTMFTCHLDTAGDKAKVNLNEYEDNGTTFISSDGTTILGADDKAGVSVLTYMILNKVPGLYYFFLGEEEGSKGANQVAGNFFNLKHLESIKNIVSFDRKGHESIITHQMGEKCCSDEFAEKLIFQFANHGLTMKKDDTGAQTDSFAFRYISQICEITNVSVGYYNEHTADEVQDMTFLIKLAKASIQIEWDSLPDVQSTHEGYLFTNFSDFRRS